MSFVVLAARALVGVLVVVGLGVAAAPAGAAAGAGGARALPEHVCFWTEPGQHGNSWCYRPGGYAEVPVPVKRNAHSFSSDVNASTYAISWTRWGCIYREIRAYDYSDQWDWADKLDGMDSNVPADCERG